MPKQVLESMAVRLAVATVAAGLFVGCEKSETTPASSTPAASDAAKSAADSAKSAADSAQGAASDAAKSAGDAAKSAGDAASNAAGNAAATVSGDKPAAAPGDAAAAPADAASESTAKATELLAQVSTYVKENKMDLAEKALAELDKLKPNLPAEYASKIDGAHKMFDAAKSGKGLGEIKDNLLGK
jgi:hypothetical protein